MVTSKLVTIESYGKISVLGGLMGPITTPCRLDTNTIIALINSGKIVYEVNPNNMAEKIRLNRLNINSVNFKKDVIPSIKQTNVVKSNDNHNKNHAVETHDTNVDNKHNNNGEKLTNADAFVSNKKS